jgi:hypothetical protein
MPGDRVRVLPLIPRTGLHWLCVGLGLMHGLCGSWFVVAINDWLESFNSSGVWGPLKIGACVLGGFLVPAILFSMLIIRVHGHYGRLMLCAVIYAPFCVLGIFAVIIAINPQMLVVNPTDPAQSMGIWMAAIMGLGVGGAVLTFAVACAFTAGFLIEHFAGRRIIRQTGSICWSCGYDLGVKGAGVCPECGRAFDLALRIPARSQRFLGRLVRARRVLLIAALALLVVPIAYEFATYAAPAIRFLNGRPIGVEVKPTTMVNTWVYRHSGGNFSRGVSPLGDGWWLPDPGSVAAGTVVQFLPDARAGEPSMFVTRASMHDFAATTTVNGIPVHSFMLAPGSPRVVARLNRDQAAQVIAGHAVPQGLLDKLRERADALNWIDAGYPQGSKPEESVDPAPFFSNPSNTSSRK